MLSTHKSGKKSPIHLRTPSSKSAQKVFIQTLTQMKGTPLTDVIPVMVDVSLERFLPRKNFLKVFFEKIYELNKMDDVFRARRLLASEMTQVLRECYPGEFKDDHLETSLFLLFNSYLGTLQAFTANAERIGVEQLKENLIQTVRACVLKWCKIDELFLCLIFNRSKIVCYFE